MDAETRQEARLIVGIFGVVLLIVVVPILFFGSSTTTAAVIAVLLIVVMVGFALAGRRWGYRS